VSAPLAVGLVGPGAVGGVIAAGLVRGGARLALWGRRGRVDRLAPVRFADGSEWPGSKLPASGPAPEVVLLAVKAGDMADALARAREIAPGAPVVPLVNGIPFWLLPRLGRSDLPAQLHAVDPEARLADLLPRLEVVGAVVQVPAERVEGAVRAGANPRLMIEAGGGAPLDRLADVLRAGGIAVDRPQDLLPDLFEKLMGNAVLNPLTALTGLSVGEAARRLREQTRRGMEEVTAVARGLGLAFHPDIPARIYRAEALTGHSTSMLQDVVAGRRTEIDAITGATVELASALGVDTPVLSLLHGILAARDAQLR
jgi:2-dehydropantoate 2-reductase